MTAWLFATLRCLRAEGLKLKRTLAPVLAVVFPLMPGVLQVLILLQEDTRDLPPRVDRGGFFLFETFAIWCLVLLPLFVALECSITAGIEHHNHGFRRLLSLPVPRSSIYAAKLATNVLLVAVGYGVLVIGSALSLRTAAFLRSDAGLDVPFPWAFGLRLAALTFAASLLMLVIHSFVALRWPSVALNVGLAVVGIVGSLTVKGALRDVYPWSLPGRVQGMTAGLAFGWDSTHSMAEVHRAVLLCSALTVLLLGLGGRVLVRRDVT